MPPKIIIGKVPRVNIQLIAKQILSVIITTGVQREAKTFWVRVSRKSFVIR